MTDREQVIARLRARANGLQHKYWSLRAADRRTPDPWLKGQYRRKAYEIEAMHAHIAYRLSELGVIISIKPQERTTHYAR